MAVFRVERTTGYQTENFYAVIEKQRKLEKEVSAIVNGRTKNHDPRGKKTREA